MDTRGTSGTNAVSGANQELLDTEGRDDTSETTDKPNSDNDSDSKSDLLNRENVPKERNEKHPKPFFTKRKKVDGKYIKTCIKFVLYSFFHKYEVCPKSIRPALLIIFFDCEGVVHYEFAPRGQSINKEYYLEVLKRLRDAVRRKRPRFWSSGDWLLHHDNAPAHSSNLVQQFLAKHKIVQFHQPPYSPEIAPCDFWMFLKLKMALKGKRFDDIQTIQSNPTRELKAIPKPAFKDCFKMPRSG